MEKSDAIVIFSSCRINTTLELLSLVQWPNKRYHFKADENIVNELSEKQFKMRETLFKKNAH